MSNATKTIQTPAGIEIHGAITIAEIRKRVAAGKALFGVEPMITVLRATYTDMTDGGPVHIKKAEGGSGHRATITRLGLSVDLVTEGKSILNTCICEDLIIRLSVK